MRSAARKITKDRISGHCQALEKALVIEMLLYTSDESRVVTPRMFIAAAAYRRPVEVVREFLNNCLQSESQTLVEIARDVLDGRKPGVQLI